MTKNLLELSPKPEVLAVHLRKLLGSRVLVLQIPLELVLELVRADDDVDLSGARKYTRPAPPARAPRRTLIRMRISSCIRLSSSSNSSTAIGAPGFGGASASGRSTASSLTTFLRLRVRASGRGGSGSLYSARARTRLRQACHHAASSPAASLPPRTSSGSSIIPPSSPKVAECAL